jgi:cell division protein FtsZ
VAQQGLEDLKAVADGVITLPNEKVLKLIDESTSVLDTFRLTDELLADAVRGVWRLVAHSGLIEIHFSDLCDLLRDKHGDSAFAVAEAIGPTRSREVIDKLKAHPMLEAGSCLREAGTVMLSLLGGPDLTMAEVNRVVQELTGDCAQAQVVMGASIDEGFHDRLSVTLIASRKSSSDFERRTAAVSDGLEAQLLDGDSAPRHAARFAAPPPALSADQMRQMAARGSGGGRSRKSLPRLRQTQLTLDIVSKGRFEKSEPTIHKGEDLDVPTFIRRGIPLFRRKSP